MAKEEGQMDMARLVMTPFFKSDHHIGIKALADVFVDNPTYNAHSTAMDTLWGALPFVSLPEVCRQREIHRDRDRDRQTHIHLHAHAHAHAHALSHACYCRRRWLHGWAPAC